MYIRRMTDYQRFTAALMLRLQGPGLKVSEIEEYHAQPHRPAALATLLRDPSAPGPMGSRDFDSDWLRISKCCNPRAEVVMKDSVFTPGSLHGKWIGDFFVRIFRLFFSLELILPFTCKQDHDYPEVREDQHIPLGHVMPNIMEFDLRYVAVSA